MTSSDLHTSSQSFDNIAIISRIIDTGIVASSVLIQLKNCICLLFILQMN